MNSEFKIPALVRQNLIPILIGSLGVVLLLIGLLQFAARVSKSSPVVLDQTSHPEDAKSQIVVDVEGAVINPGVYKIDSESRIVDALAAAGGMCEEADRDWVEKNVNLAKPVSDGLKIYIPRRGEQILGRNQNRVAN